MVDGNKKLVRVLALCWFVIIVLLVAINRKMISDFWIGLNYHPTDEMAKIRDALDLTSEGIFVFNAVWPELNDSESFNQNCLSTGSEIAVLGCYRNGRVYIYNITDEQLDGIRELTTAHEFLHAIYERMSKKEKRELYDVLKKAYADNLDILKADIGVYSKDEQFEELYVRAGTQVKDLPEELELHYGRFFKNQDKVVDFYNQYIQVFKEIERKMEELSERIEDSTARINEKTSQYEKDLETLENDISIFNNCAATAGCFSNESEFRRRRSGLISRQNELENLYNEINLLIDKHNGFVEEYNDNVVQSKRLNKIINSNSKPSEI